MLLMPEIGRDQGLEMNSDKNLDTIRSSMAIPGLHIHVRSDKNTATMHVFIVIVMLS